MISRAETARPFSDHVALAGAGHRDWELGIRNFRAHLQRQVILIDMFVLIFTIYYPISLSHTFVHRNFALLPGQINMIV